MDIHFINNISSQLLSIKDKTFNLLTQQQKKIGAVVLVVLGGLALGYFIYRCCCIKATWMNQPSYEDIDDQPQKATTLIDQQNQKVDDQPEEEKMPIDDLPIEIRAHIFSFVNDPLLTGQVSKDWEGITQAHVLKPLVKNIENYLGEKRVQIIYQPTLQKEDIEVEQLSDRKKLLLLVQNQRQRLSYLLGKENAEAFLKSQPKTIDLTQFITQEQWIKDYNLILMCNKTHLLAEQATLAIRQVKQQEFDIAPMAEQLRNLINDGQLNQLQLLNLSNNQLTELPPEIGQLIQLQQLRLSDNQLTKLPPQIGQLARLGWLYLSNNQLTKLPQEIGQLARLGWLDLSNNQLTEIPQEIGQLAQLGRLDLSNNQLTEIPQEIGQLTQLQRLYLDNNKLTGIPQEIRRLRQLQELDLSNNQLTEVQEIGQLPQLQLLDLHNNQFIEIRQETRLLAKLHELNLSNNKLTGIPQEIRRLRQLQELDLSNNQLTEIPQEIGQLTQLQRLYLSNNQLTEIPQEIGQLAQLRRLDLKGNPLDMPFNLEIHRLIQQGIAKV